MPDEGLLAATARAEEFLLLRQDADGAWRDYPSLDPGASESWVTAVVGWALSQQPASHRVVGAVLRSADALHRWATPDGWGYNHRTACDADSTSWAWRLLLRLDDRRGRTVSRDLARFGSGCGGASTFVGTEFGAWSGDHPDVVAVVGLALAENGIDSPQIARLRERALALRNDQGVWTSYWWTDAAYAVARNIEFLDVSGGIPQAVGEAVGRWLRAQPSVGSAFDTAQRLLTSVALDERSRSDDFGERLLSLQCADGAWPVSETLRVPQQFGAASSTPVFADELRLMSTAMALTALKALTRRCKFCPDSSG